MEISPGLCSESGFGAIARIFRHQPSHKGGLPITMSPIFPETDFLRLPLKMLYSRAARMKHANYVMRDKKRGVVYTWLAIHPTKYIMLMKCTSR